MSRHFVDIDVFDADVANMVDRVMGALSPMGLDRFLSGDAHDYFAEEIEMRFAWEGDAASGDWDRLTDATQNIRQHAGFPPDGPINERTGDMLRYLTQHLDVTQLMDGAVMQIPGDASGEMERKIRHAQVGAKIGENPLFPNSSTPARPVLAIDEDDVVVVLAMLERHIMMELGVVI
jgi:hypothetical protein